MHKKNSHSYKNLRMVIFCVIASLSVPAFALSPPIIAPADDLSNTDYQIPWDANGDGIADNFNSLTDSSVAYIEAAFTNAHRKEEAYFNLPTGTLGDLRLPAQSVWDTMSDDAKALYLINAERTARANMFPGVLGLPLAGVEASVDKMSEDYAIKLTELDQFGHYYDDTPYTRLNRYVGGNCYEFNNQAENLYALFSSGEIPHPIARAIYGWIYEDAGASQWGHRTAVLLQDAPLNGNTQYGYNNNRGSAAHEGFLGFTVLHADSDYQPNGINYGKADLIVMNFFDPVDEANADRLGCNYNVTLHTEDLPLPEGSNNNQAPVAGNDSIAIDYNTIKVFSANDLLLNDSDADNDALSIISNTQPANGTLTRTVNSFTYEPKTNFSGTDSFEYTVSDGHEHTATATVTLNIGVAPNQAPKALQDEANTAYETSVTISVLANDTDQDGDTLTINGVTQGNNGNVITDGNSVTYIPNTGFSGTDSFTYTIDDGRGGTDTATVNVVVDAAPNQAPTANNDAATTPYETAITIDVLSNDADPEHDSLTLVSASEASHGTTSVVAGKVVYTPNAGYAGSDSFSYTIKDGNGNTANGTVNITVKEAIIINSNPVATDDHASTTRNVSVTINVLANDTDAEGDTLSIIDVSGASHGSTRLSDNQVIYTPHTDYIGTDSFIYTVDDGQGGTDRASVSVSIARNPSEPPEGSSNQAPVATDDSAQTRANWPVSINLLANDSDPEGDSIRIVGGTKPSHGWVYRRSATTVVYMPYYGYQGMDSFRYAITDQQGNVSYATVTITVGHPNTTSNRPPVAVDDTLRVNMNGVGFLNVLRNDSDPDGDTLSITGGSHPRHGWIVRWNSYLYYIPAHNYRGKDAFTYTISDGKGHRSTATVFITVR
ncbi:MAG: hypothetical protein CR991_11680 [Proteobacteria bacterium]|nr:MAG: hypothetical protein CR991_11680 [Pseudomonadota bacterium]